MVYPLKQNIKYTNRHFTAGGDFFKDKEAEIIAEFYYQWYSSREYSHIFKVLSFEDLQKMYYTLHEADLTKFADIVDLQMKEYFSETNLKRIRTIYGFTQAELAERSGVSLRSIQMYEQRNKNINKASADTMYRLAKVLGCTMEDLIEK